MFSFIKSLHFHLSQLGRQESADNKEPITESKYANGVPSGTNATYNCEKMKFDYHFDYCNIVWGNCGITLRNKVQKLQNRAARVLAYSSYDVDAGHLFKLLGWKNLPCQQQIQRATMVYRSLHGLAPNYLSSKFERREVTHNLRDSENKLNVPLPRTNYYKNSFSYSGAILWNSLPLGNLNDYSKNCKARHSWKAAF